MAMTKREKIDLEVAQMRVREANERISVLFGKAPTNTFTSTTALEYQPLLPNANIKFALPGIGNIIQAQIRNGWLQIMGDTQVEIMPQSSNVIQIRCKANK